MNAANDVYVVLIAGPPLLCAFVCWQLWKWSKRADAAEKQDGS